MKLNRRGSATIVAIIILALVSVGSLGYIGYDKIIKKAEIKGEDKEDKTTVKETKDTNKTIRENDVINTTSGKFVVDYENNKIQFTANEKTQEIVIPNEKIKKAVFYGNYGNNETDNCPTGGKYIVILTENGNIYVNNEPQSQSKQMDFVKVDTSLVTNIKLSKEETDIGSVNDIDAELLQEQNRTCGFAALRISDETNEFLYKLDFSCGSEGVKGAKINYYSASNGKLFCQYM